MQYPIVLQQSWLLDLVKQNVTRDHYTTSLVKKDAVKEGHRTTPILRIFRFTKLTEGLDLTAILADSTHKMLAIFPYRPTVRDFELKNSQRLTYHTANALVVIRRANLRFVSSQEARSLFGMVMDGPATLVLEVMALDMFLRDQVSLSVAVEKRLVFLYDDPVYRLLCGKRPLSDDPETENEPLCDDDVVSM